MPVLTKHEQEERQKKIKVIELLRQKWGKEETVNYKGKKYYIGCTAPEPYEWRIETQRCHNLPETATYTIGKDALLIATDDNDLSDWEFSKEILLEENPN